MTLPVTPNPISLQAIATEFGGSSPVNLTNYYAGGAHVATGTVGYPGGVSTPIPISGPISLQNFYGSSAAYPPTLFTFTTSQNWTVPANVYSINMLVVGGGGGGGSTDGSTNEGGGGGGAGGVIFTKNYSVVPGTIFNILIGAGGTAGNGGNGGYGGDTSISYNLGGGPIAVVAYGGGGGGGKGVYTGSNGASGGGRSPFDGLGVPGSAIYGNQGHDGGAGAENNFGGGGGGYASAAPSPGGAGPDGGIGAYFVMQSSTLSVGGGGGGGASGVAYNGGGNGGPGYGSGAAGLPGAVNTGGGGGGNSNAFAPGGGGAGGSGVVYFSVNEPPVTGSPTPDGAFNANISTSLPNPGTATAGFTISPDGTINAVNTGGFASNTMGSGWFSPVTTNIGYRYWAYVTRSGNTLSDGSAYLGQWIQLFAPYTFSVSATAVPTDGTVTRTATITVQISDGPGTGSIIATSVIIIEADASGDA